MESEQKPQPSFSFAKRWQIFLTVVIATVALLAIVGMANYLSARHFWRYQVGGATQYRLNDATRQVLNQITNRLEIIVLFNRQAPLFDLVEGLLREYSYACPYVDLKFVDYTRDPGQAEWITSKYMLPRSDTDLVIFDYKGRHRIVRSSELSDYNINEWLSGKETEIRRVSFKGELLFTSAIAGLLQAKRPIVYFLQGHGEHDPESTERTMGYSRFAKLLANKNVEVQKLTLSGGKKIPSDCSLLIIAGPKASLTEVELQHIDEYFRNGGRGLILLSFYQAGRKETGLERLLRRYHVAVGNNYVLDPPNSIRGNDLVITNFFPHPIMNPLRGRSLYMVLARSVEPIRQPRITGDEPKVQVLFASSVHGMTASRFTKEGAPVPDPAVDRHGVIPLAVAVQQGQMPGVGADHTAMRLVVVGESIFLGDETIVKLSNWEFASSAVNWLLEQPSFLATIAPKPIKEYRIDLTRGQLRKIAWILLGGIPGIILVFGVFVWWWRHE